MYFYVFVCHNQIKSFIFESRLDGLQSIDKDIIRNKKKWLKVKATLLRAR